MSRFQVKYENEEDTLKVVFQGVVDENAHLFDIFDQIDQNVVLDLAAVDRMNSIGVMQWVKSISGLTDRQTVRIQNASQVFVVQANYVAQMFAKARVESFIAPYYCGSCRQEHGLSLKPQEVIDKKPPQKICPECNATLEFSEVNSYFSFLDDLVS